MNSNLSETEINTLIRLMRQDWQAAKINIDSGLYTNRNIDSLTEDYKAIKDKLELLRLKDV